MDHLCFLCLVFLMLSHLFIAVLWSPAGKGETSWLLLVRFIVFLFFPHVASWVWCDFCLFDLIFYVHSTILQLCGTGLPGLNQY